jgi:hypothetical protein
MDHVVAGKILVEMPNSRDGLDHILDVVNDRTAVLAATDVAKLRTTSQIRPVSPFRSDAYMIDALVSNLE